MLLANKSYLDYFNIFNDIGMTPDETCEFVNSKLKKPDGTSPAFRNGDNGAPTILKFAYYNQLNTSILQQTATDVVTDTTDKAEIVNGSVELIVGSGSTAPIISDYSLENQITTLEHISISKEYGANGTNIIRTFKNTANSNITVSEVGIIIRLPEDFNTCGWGEITAFPILIARNILDTPLTIAPNTYFTVIANL